MVGPWAKIMSHPKYEWPMILVEWTFYIFWVNKIVTYYGDFIHSQIKGGVFSESAIFFSNLQLSKKNIPKNYPELEI